MKQKWRRFLIQRRMILLRSLTALFIGVLVSFFASCERSRDKVIEKRSIFLAFTPQPQVSDREFQGKLEFSVQDALGQVSNERLEIVLDPQQPTDVKEFLDTTVVGAGSLSIVSHVNPLQLRLQLNGEFAKDEAGKPKVFTFHFPRDMYRIPPPATIKITKLPEGVTVSIDENEVQGGEERELSSGESVELKVELTGQKEKEEASKEPLVQIVREPPAPKLFVTSEPPGATVYLNDESELRAQTPSVLTLERGQRYSLRVEKDGHHPVTDTIDVGEQEVVQREYTLEPIAIAGTVRYQETQKPVVGARIIVTVDDIKYYEITDPEGKFELRGLLSIGKTYTFTASDSQERFRQLSQKHSVEQATPIQLFVERQLRISVHVIDFWRKKRVEGAEVRIEKQQARTDLDGKATWVIKNPPKMLSVAVTQDEYWEANQLVETDGFDRFVSVYLMPKFGVVALETEKSSEQLQKEIVKVSDRETGKALDFALDGKRLFITSGKVGRKVFVYIKNEPSPILTRPTTEWKGTVPEMAETPRGTD